MRKKIHKKIIEPFLYFTKNESSGGILLLFCTIIALIIANSNLSQSYNNILHTYITIGYKDISISMSLLHWINDGLMTIFFLVVGMEIKRELVIGELKSLKATILPISAAIGGMIVPAIIFALFNFNEPTITGWGIPMATDIAFALGILSLVSKKAPKGIVVFLTALAIVDDLGAIIVIAIFYTNKLSLIALLIGSLVLLALILANKFKIHSTPLFIILGLILWACILKSGIHATIAGVLLGLTLPAAKNESEFENSMLNRIEHALVPWSTFLVMPIFALANSGITIDTSSISTNLFSPISIGVILGLFIGKQLGIFGASYILLKLNLATLPSEVTKRHIYGASILGGIGFTMSLFVSSLSFSDNTILSTAKMSIIIASVLSAILGAAFFKIIDRTQTD